MEGGRAGDAGADGRGGSQEAGGGGGGARGPQLWAQPRGSWMPREGFQEGPQHFRSCAGISDWVSLLPVS